MVKNKDKWSALSLKDRADLINMYITNGISDLTEMKKHYNGVPYRDLNTSDYDYFNASPEMTPTKKGQHWDSRNPHTGRLLKGENHPTFDLMVEGENKAGYKIIRGYNGELYSIPNTPDNYVENYNSFDTGGDTNDEEKVSFWKRLLESGQSARDARVGAVGAQQVRDLYTEGKTKEANDLAIKYAKANTTGISLAGGTASTNLIGDLLISGATTAADTLIEGDTSNLTKNLIINSVGDVAGKAFETVPIFYKWVKNSANDVLNISSFDDAVNSAMDFYKRNFDANIKASDFNIGETSNLPEGTTGVYHHGSKGIDIKKDDNHLAQRGTIAHEMRHHEDADLNTKSTGFILDDDSIYGVTYGRKTLSDDDKKTLEKAYRTVKNTTEHPAINVDYKEVLEQMYIKDKGKIPTVEELNAYINSLPYPLLALTRGITGYSSFKSVFDTALFPDNVKKALTTVKKEGGKINRFDIGGNTNTPNKTREQIAAELQSKSRNELLSLQQTLADAGYYDQTLQLGKNDSAFGLQDFLIGKGLLTTNDRDGSIGENTIKALQTFLINEKYLPRYTETGYDNIDGKLGNTTQNAYNTYLRKSNVDGFYGDKTLNAYYNYLNQNNAGIQLNNSNLSKDEFFKYVNTPIRQQTWQSKGFKGWTDEDLLYLYNQLPTTGWDPRALMYAIDRETNFMPYAKSPISSAIGLAQLTKDQLKQLYRESYGNLSEEELLNRVNRAYNSYKDKTRSIRDIIDDTILQYSWMRNRIKTEPENMGYGRIKVNLLAPNARLDDVVPKYVYEGSLTKDQQSKIKLGKATYRDLMMMYDEEFKNKFNL